MNRTARDNRDRYTSLTKPVEKVELNEKHPRARILMVVLLAIVGAGFLSYAFVNFLNKDEGWSEIKASTSSELNCSGDFVFHYNLSDGTLFKELQLVYTDACVKAYRLFNIDEENDEYYNVKYINTHPNDEIEVDEVLYEAFEEIASYEDRSIYLGPVYDYYDNIFYCENENELNDYDPYLNDDVEAEFKKVAEYAMDDSKVNIELLGNNTIKLVVLDDYLEFAEANGITNYIDFYWMKNAFIIDYIADTMIEHGYVNGIVSSIDGYTRALGECEEGYLCNLYNLKGNTVYGVGAFGYNTARSTVSYRSYGISDEDEYRFYEASDGIIRTKYLSTEDGLNKLCISELVSYSDSLGCSEVVLMTKDSFIADEFDADRINELAAKDINSIYIDDSVVYYTDSKLELGELYKGENIEFSSKLSE